jgi:hypothetical protein
VLACPPGEQEEGVGEGETFRVTDRRGGGEQSTGPAISSASPSPAPAQGGPSLSDSIPSDSGSLGHPLSCLSELFMMFTSSALVNLGAVPEPGTDQHRVDLAQAQAAIDMLLMLREKTQGNRTDPESQLLDEVVYDLQMRFVQASRVYPKEGTS